MRAEWRFRGVSPGRTPPHVIDTIARRVPRTNINQLKISPFVDKRRDKSKTCIKINKIAMSGLYLIDIDEPQEVI